ncbi:XrtA/PEP-CTERM system histidine kinase PrsK [Azohydromonas sediminis]|uniref:XrtA/PEP-CTERM system histidine kinase PrsK n=1 Tax=Azohydromonas sediminis TaxID=2259674 RepID=UPI000E6478A4|nr:XrtA/PEP-CTERM system histidine kinase PrsK [Azohydromonas sediminis]
MDTAATDLTGYGFAVAGLLYAAFGAHLAFTGLLKKSQPAAPWTFLSAVAATALWGVVGAVEMWVTGDATAPSIVGADLARHALWFGFLLGLLHPDTGARPAWRDFGVLGMAAAALIVATGALIALDAARALHPTWRLRVEPLLLLGIAVLGLILVEQLFRNLPEDSRWSAKPLCLGLGLLFVYDIYLYSQAVLFAHLDGDALAVRGVVHALAVPLLFVASKRHANWIAKLRVSRAAAFHSATLLLAGAYLLFMSAIGYYVRYTGGEWGRALQIALLVAALAALAVLAVSGTVRAKLRVFLGKHLFHYRYDYRKEWLQFTSRLTATHSPQELGTSVTHGLADLVESPAGALWLKSADGRAFVQAAGWNMPPSAAREPADSPFAAFLLERGWIVDLDECRDRPARYDGLVVPDSVRSAPQAWLVVPLIVADALIGWVVLARARTPLELDWEVTDLLKTAARQAAAFLAQMQATEALLEARKFDAFNRMSAFVVHDLKNIVTQLSLLLKNAQRHRDNPEFQQDMLATVENSLDKMRQLMLQLREGQAPAAGRPSGVDLAPIAQRLAAMARERGREVEVMVIDRVMTRGHEERVERVLGHLVHNALDATQPDQRVWLKLERASGQARIEVGDTGCGMSQEFVNTRLFKPFSTTKKTGMGIGTFESFQYVQELGGKIEVDSREGAGTVVTLLMPLFDAGTEDRPLALQA